MKSKEMKQISFLISNALDYLSPTMHEEFLDALRKFVFEFIGGKNDS